MGKLALARGMRYDSDTAAWYGSGGRAAAFERTAPPPAHLGSTAAHERKSPLACTYLFICQLPLPPACLCALLHLHAFTHTCGITHLKHCSCASHTCDTQPLYLLSNHFPTSHHTHFLLPSATHSLLCTCCCTLTLCASHTCHCPSLPPTCLRTCRAARSRACHTRTRHRAPRCATAHYFLAAHARSACLPLPQTL